MKLIDTHAHLDFESFDVDRHNLIEDLERQEIGVVAIATTLESNNKVIELATSNRLIWGMLGIHPTDVTKEIIEDFPNILQGFKQLLSENNKLVGIGEVGLDYFHDHEDESANRQKAALRQFLTFAKESNLPLSIHCREAYGDLITMLSDYANAKFVIHCFSGTLEQAQSFLDLGGLLSFTAIISYPKNEALRQVVRAVPLERIMLETDSPLLPWKDNRGNRNDPRTVLQLASLVAEIKAVTVEEVMNVTTQNAVNFFGLREGAKQ